MVRLTKIYTRTGDDGTTGLGSGSRTPKDSARVEAYGDVDESNAAIGVAVTACAGAVEGSAEARIGAVLRAIQHDLFDVGADLCIPLETGEKEGSKLRIQASQTERLEWTIDEFNEHLSPLNSFVLPGGSSLASALHVARTVTRRAERRAVTLLRAEPKATNPETVRYLNRLSDLLFVLARAANRNGTGDVLWVPGATREGGAVPPQGAKNRKRP
jgi:cob(I)alamin adenosyltransferase